MKNRKGKRVRAKSGLNNSILDQGWYEFRRQLDYKLEWNGGYLIVVSPHNTSRRCPHCGHVSADNRKTRAGFEQPVGVVVMRSGVPGVLRGCCGWFGLRQIKDAFYRMKMSEIDYSSFSVR